MSVLKVDAARAGLNGSTGIYVRALGIDGHWVNADIAELDKPSLVEWLRSREDVAERALLGHTR